MPEKNRKQRTYFHSDEADDILGKMPPWIIRRGIGVIFLVFLGILAGCYFIRYPQLVKAPIVITTLEPPADLVFPAAGRIGTLFAGDGDTVSAGAPVALLCDAADYRAVCEVESLLRRDSAKGTVSPDGYGWTGREYVLGELQPYYADFRRLCLDFRHYLRTGYLPRKKELLSRRLDKNREYYVRQQEQRRLLAEDLEYERRNLDRDSALFRQGRLSRAELERSAQLLVQKKNALAGADAALTSTEMGLLQTEQQLVDLSVQYDNAVTDYRLELDRSRQQLLSRIGEWKDRCLVVSPVAGRLSFARSWIGNQSVQAGERLASVLPPDSTQVIGKMYIPSTGYGKVAVGQKVNVKLNGYPYMEYGMLHGRVFRLSAVPEEEGYAAEVVFPDGMRSSYKENLGRVQQMDGTGEIITHEMRLIERFIQPLRALFERFR